jgi:hypothetical protein
MLMMSMMMYVEYDSRPLRLIVGERWKRESKYLSSLKRVAERISDLDSSQEMIPTMVAGRDYHYHYHPHCCC